MISQARDFDDFVEQCKQHFLSEGSLPMHAFARFKGALHSASGRVSIVKQLTFESHKEKLQKLQAFGRESVQRCAYRHNFGTPYIAAPDTLAISSETWTSRSTDQSPREDPNRGEALVFSGLQLEDEGPKPLYRFYTILRSGGGIDLVPSTNVGLVQCRLSYSVLLGMVTEHARLEREIAAGCKR